MLPAFDPGPSIQFHQPHMPCILKTLFWVACFCVTVFSLLPAQTLPSAMFDWWDKAQHALAFVVLGGLGLGAHASKPRQVIAGLLVFGVLIELSQSATGWRTGDWQDWLADAIGVGLAWAGRRALLSCKWLPTRGRPTCRIHRA